MAVKTPPWGYKSVVTMTSRSDSTLFFFLNGVEIFFFLNLSSTVKISLRKKERYVWGIGIYVC